MGYDEPFFNLCRMSNPATPGCDGPENEFARQGGITNGAAWYVGYHFVNSKKNTNPQQLTGKAPYRL
jgi:hypothetical protein